MASAWVGRKEIWYRQQAASLAGKACMYTVGRVHEKGHISIYIKLEAVRYTEMSVRMLHVPYVPGTVRTVRCPYVPYVPRIVRTVGCLDVPRGSW